MKVLPWLCVVGLLAGLGWVYSASQKKDAALAALRAEHQQLQQERAALEEAAQARTEAENNELLRLRKDHEELLRLRNEVRQLRADKDQLGAQVRSAQAQARTAQAEAQGAQEQLQTLRVSAALPVTSAPGAPAAPATPEQQQAQLCIHNLRLIHAAKQQWAQQRQKPSGTLITPADIAPLLPNQTVPSSCPAGGVYTLNPIGVPPICNIPGHSLAK